MLHAEPALNSQRLLLINQSSISLCQQHASIGATAAYLTFQAKRIKKDNVIVFDALKWKSQRTLCVYCVSKLIDKGLNLGLHSYEWMTHSYESFTHSYEWMTHSYDSFMHSYEWITHPYDSFTHSCKWVTHSYESFIHSYKWMTHSYESFTHSYEWMTHSYELTMLSNDFFKKVKAEIQTINKKIIKKDNCYLTIIN